MVGLSRCPVSVANLARSRHQRNPLNIKAKRVRLTTVGTPPLHHFPWLLGISKIPSCRKVRLVFFKNLFLKSSGVWVDFPNDMNYPVACSKTNE